MIKVNFGEKIVECEAPITVYEAARAGELVSRATLACEIGGEICALSKELNADADVKLLTFADEGGKHVFRHTASHILAQAVKRLYPEAKLTIGPAIENGFYYDFSRKEPFTTEDFEKIEAKMHEIVKRDEKVERKVLPRNEAIAYFKGIGENYKAEIIEDLPESETISLYTQGNFTDLCRGPHVPSTGKVGDAFKLMKVAGAYWRGDSTKEMLQRIYATAWANKKELDEYLKMLE